MDEPGEGRGGAGRVEAFSDGVIAIIVTIMVLELKVPEHGDWRALLPLWPIFLAYVLSYAYVAIYWVNHHRLFSHAVRVSNTLIWSNMALLFTLSLIPFSTAYLGTHHFSTEAAQLYLASMALPSICYAWLHAAIRSVSKHDGRTDAYHVATSRKGYAAIAVYIAGIPLSAVSPWLGIACAALVALFWIKPWSRLDSLFLRCEAPG